jgi:hypothetical protein
MNPTYSALDDPALGYCDLLEAGTATFLEPVFECADNASSLLASRYPVKIGGEIFELPKFLVLGERGGGVPIRLGLYAGLDAGQLDTVIAASRLLLQLELSPALARDYALFAAPVVNLPGFGPDQEPLVTFQRRFADAAASDTPPEDDDVRYFHVDFAKWQHHGLILLRSTGLNRAFTATTRSRILADEVVAPALHALSGIVPIAEHPVRVLPSTREARRADCEAGRLLPLPGTEPWPFEIELYAPAGTTCEARVRALFLAVVSILRGYRHFIAHGGEL